MGSMLMAQIKMTFSCYTISFISVKLTEDMKVQQNLIIIFFSICGGIRWWLNFASINCNFGHVSLCMQIWILHTQWGDGGGGEAKSLWQLHFPWVALPLDLLFAPSWNMHLLSLERGPEINFAYIYLLFCYWMQFPLRPIVRKLVPTTLVQAGKSFEADTFSWAIADLTENSLHNLLQIHHNLSCRSLFWFLFR